MRMEGKKTTTKTSEMKDEGEVLVDLSGSCLGSLHTLSDSPSLILASITKLDLSNNNLEIFPESLTARLLNLEVMDVHSNQLRALPNSISCLSKLRILNVSSNLLDSLPRSIENCRALEELMANFNELTRLPDTMGFELTNLRKLSVNSNKLSFLPSSTSHMTSLRSLDARLNRLISLPDGLENLIHLRSLDARLNRLISLPDGLENLIHLRSLDVSQNFHHLASLPSSIGLLPSLTDLDVSYNSISALPDSISCLSNLFKLRTEGNPLIHPPPAVAQRGVMAVQEYLRASKNNADNTKGGRRRRPSWIMKLVRCSTVSHHHHPHGFDEREEFLPSMEIRSFGRLVAPRHEGMLSPWRLFSPKRPATAPASPMK